jgi:hypothetical protein
MPECQLPATCLPSPSFDGRGTALARGRTKQTTTANNARPPKNKKMRLVLSNGIIFMSFQKARLEMK